MFISKKKHDINKFFEGEKFLSEPLIGRATEKYLNMWTYF